MQETVLVAYEVTGQRMWHDVVELSSLDELAPRQPEADDVQEVGSAQWQKLPLRCCFSLARLTDPAWCAGCTHPPRCNFDSLQSCLKTSRECPVTGCSVKSIRSRDIHRDESLRTALAQITTCAEFCWLRGQSEVLSAEQYSGASADGRLKGAMETAAAVEVLDRTRERAAEPTETRHDGNSAKRARHAVVNRVAAPGSSRPPRFFPVACEAQSRINRPEPSFEGVSSSSVVPPAPLLLPTASASSKTARKRVNTPGRMDPARKETEGSVEQSTPSSGTAQINPVPLAVQTAPVTLLTTIFTTAELNERKKMLEAFERALDQRHWIRETALEKREMALERREAEPFQMAIAERETALTCGPRF